MGVSGECGLVGLGMGRVWCDVFDLCCVAAEPLLPAQLLEERLQVRMCTHAHTHTRSVDSITATSPLTLLTDSITATSSLTLLTESCEHTF